MFAEAATKANSVKVDDLAKAMRANKFDTVIGTIGFDAKGDVIGPDYVVYVWNDGKYARDQGLGAVGYFGAARAGRPLRPPPRPRPILLAKAERCSA